MDDLTDLNETQQKAFEFIRNYITTEGVAPSYREIMAGINLTSPGHIDQILDALQKKGYIKRKRSMARAISLVDRSEKT